MRFDLALALGVAAPFVNATAHAWALAPTADPYARDLKDLCAMAPPLDPAAVRSADHGGRIDLMRTWVTVRGRTPEIRELLARIADAPPRERGAILRAIRAALARP